MGILDEDLSGFLDREKKKRMGLPDDSPESALRSRVMTNSSIAPPNPQPGLELPGIGKPIIKNPQFAKDDAELQRLKSTGAGVDQIENPVGRVMAKVADIAGSALFPRLATAIPGTTMHHQKLMAQAQTNVNQDLSEQKTQAGIHGDEAQAERDRAMAAKATRPEEDKAIHTYTNADGQVVTIFQKPSGETYESGFGMARPPHEAVSETELADRAAKGDKTAEAALQRLAQQKKAGRTVVNTGERQDEKDAHTRIPTEELSQINSSLGEGQKPYPIGTTYGQIKNAGITPKSKKELSTLNLSKVEDRAALADNVKENAAIMRDIMQRRPELFGSFNGGIMTRGKELVGTGDPDILKWERAKTNMGKANVGMHNMRSKFALEQDEDTYSFKHDPSGIEGSLQAQESSADQFKHEFEQGGPSRGGEPARPSNVPSGYIFKENGPKGKGWYKP